MKHFSIVFFIVIITLITSACGAGKLMEPTSTPLPTNTPVSTSPPTLTPTFTPTITHIPTFTPTPTIEPPQILNEFLTNVKILSHDTFDNLNNWDWNNENSTLANGIFEMRGESFWASSIVLKQQLLEGNAVLLKFKVQKANAQSEFVFSTGEWQTDGFRQFGIYNGLSPMADLFQGKNGIGGSYLHGNLTLKPNNWFNVLMSIGKNGNFLAVIWDPNNEAHRDVYNEKLIAEKWAGKTWGFHVGEDEGETISIDDFYSISFGEIK
jgi:hypothetical protein